MDSLTDKMLFFRQVPMFQHLTIDELRVLALHVETQLVEAKEVIYFEGEIGNALYIVSSGQVRIVKNFGTPYEQDLAMLKPKDFFGEIGIFDMSPHSVTAVASEVTCVLMLSGAYFKQLITQHPTLAFAIARELTARIRRATRSQWDIGEGSGAWPGSPIQGCEHSVR